MTKDLPHWYWYLTIILVLAGCGVYGGCGLGRRRSCDQRYTKQQNNCRCGPFRDSVHACPLFGVSADFRGFLVQAAQSRHSRTRTYRHARRTPEAAMMSGSLNACVLLSYWNCFGGETRYSEVFCCRDAASSQNTRRIPRNLDGPVSSDGASAPMTVARSRKTVARRISLPQLAV